MVSTPTRKEKNIIIVFYRHTQNQKVSLYRMFVRCLLYLSEQSQILYLNDEEEKSLMGK